jgi:N-acetylglucosaminyldiphosphoundecaprenol N-acetyl-beta-D-mannosaminyltransferase
VEEINRLSPDVIWVGLGTPKQQQWIHDNKSHLTRGVVLTVGFAFDVNAGTKLDAPMWMQRLGLTWLFRISQEPRRLLGRYLKYNTWFVWFCLIDLARYMTKRAR